MRFMYKNKSGETYPAYGCGRLNAILSTDEATGNPVFELVKPDGKSGIYVINGPNNIADDDLGVAFSLKHATLVLIDDGSSSTAPTFGQVCGPTEDRWAITTSGLGLRATGESNNRTIPVESEPAATGRVTKIRFKIVSSDAVSQTAFGAVLGWDAGFDKDDVPGDLNTMLGLSPPLGVVEICDPAGCYFDEPSDELFDRVGWANRMDSDLADNCRSGYPPYDAKWEVAGLCCKKPVCELF